MMIMKPSLIDGTRKGDGEGNEDENSILEGAFQGIKNAVDRSSESFSDSFVGRVISRMNPASCLSPECVLDASNSFVVDKTWFEPPSIATTIKSLLVSLKSAGRERSAALQKLYRLTDREHESNR